jgi:hypothetical protein
MPAAPQAPLLEPGTGIVSNRHRPAKEAGDAPGLPPSIEEEVDGRQAPDVA